MTLRCFEKGALVHAHVMVDDITADHQAMAGIAVEGTGKCHENLFSRCSGINA